MFDSPISISLPSLINLRQRAAGLKLLSGSIRSPLAGGHLSRLRGRGMEFDEVRRYQTGDDARTIDWKVTARKGAPYLKQFREERERPVFLCIDYRATMFFATRGALKSVVATSIAALYGWGALAHGDRVGGLLFDEHSVWEQRPGKGKRSLLRLFHHCCQHHHWHTYPTPSSQPPQMMSNILLRLRRAAPTGSLVVMISDGRGMDESCQPYLATLTRHHTVILLHLSDPLERSFPLQQRLPVDDGSGNILLTGGDAAWHRRYQEQYQQRCEALQSRCHQCGIHWLDISTDDHLLHKLDAFGTAAAIRRP